MRVSGELRARLVEQQGLITRGQATELGMSRSALRWAVGREWTFVLPGVMSAVGPQLSVGRRLLAALLYAGPESMIGSSTAAAWHGVTAAVDHRVVVLAPAHRHPRSVGFVVVRRTHRPDASPWCRPPLVICSRARSVIDAARDDGTADGTRAIVCESVERRLVTLTSLRSELESGPSGGRALVRRALEDAEAGAWSVAEADLLRLTRCSHVLPAVWLNPSLHAVDGTRLPTPDGWIDAVGLAIQVHSRRWHSAPDDWTSTVMTDGVFAEYGVPVVAVTPQAIRRSTEAVLTRIERAYRAAVVRPRPQVIARVG